jgi:uncharacterized RDD family membrane protein YckC
MNRIVTPRMTLAIGLIVSILGIALVLLPTEENDVLKQNLRFVVPVFFSVFDDIAIFKTNDFSYSIQVFSFLFYAFLLIGCLLYAVKGEKEIRFLRFGFSVIFIALTLNLPFVIMSLINFKRILSNGDFVGTFVFSVFFKLFLLIYAYLALKKWQNSRNLRIKTTGEGEFASATIVMATKSQRFFHLLLDLFIVVLIFTPLLGLFNVFGADLNKIAIVLGEKPLVLLLTIFGRVIYYVFFEALFGATPAKMLTETQIVDYEGGGLGFGRIFKRTLCRFVPFEPFSFYSAYSGWHDRWSDSYVVKEEQTGMKGGLYGWSFLLMALLVLGCYEAIDSINTRKSDRERDFSIQKISEKRDKDLQNISSDYVLTPVIEEIPQSERPQVVSGTVTSREEIIPQVWKVDRVEGDTLVCLVLPTTNNYNSDARSGADIRAVFKQLGRNAETIKISKKDVERTLPTDGFNNPKVFVNMPNGRTRFGIKSVNAYFGYEFKSRISDYSTSSVYKGTQNVNLTIENLGLSCTLLKIDVLEGSVICNNETLPQTFNSAMIYETLRIDFDNYKKGDVFKLLLTIQDSKGATHQLMVVGVDNQSFFLPY